MRIIKDWLLISQFSYAFRGRVNLLTHWFEAYSTITTNVWTHVILNYIGHNNGQGIKIYLNGQLVVNQATRSGTTSFVDGDGQVVVGRLLKNQDKSYASVLVDELIYFNVALNDQQIEDINGLYEAWRTSSSVITQKVSNFGKSDNFCVTVEVLLVLYLSWHISSFIT